MIKFLKPYPIAVLIILLVSLFFRFYNYSNRWGLAYDQASAAIIARYALSTFQLPLLGPFSSGGPFQTGGEWYWLVMIGTALYPFHVMSPWIFITGLTVVSVMVSILIGKYLVNKEFGLLYGILMAVSSLQATQSTNLSNQTPIILFTSLALLFAVIYAKNKGFKYLFLATLMVGIGTSIHIQTVALFPFLALTFLFTERRDLFNLKNLFGKVFLVFLGIVLPWVPVLITDLSNNFYNTKNILFYFSSDQAKVPYEVLGRRWLTFAGQYVPESWGMIIGGNTIAGYALIVLSAILFVFSLITRKITKMWFVIFLSTAIMFIILRYTRTPLIYSFFVFLYPFVVLVSAWSLYRLYSYKKIIGILAIAITLFFSIRLAWFEINQPTNKTAILSRVLSNHLIGKYPDKKFTIYDHRRKETHKTSSLIMYLMEKGVASENGKKVGIVITDKMYAHIKGRDVIYGKLGGYQLYDINSTNDKDLERAGWVKTTPKNIYDSVQNWYKK